MFIQNNQSRSAVRMQSLTAICCLLRKADYWYELSPSSSLALNAQDFCIEPSAQTWHVSYVYDQVIRATVYRVDCTQTQVTGKAWRSSLSTDGGYDYNLRMFLEWDQNVIAPCTI